jgi:hypothetical protein
MELRDYQQQTIDQLRQSLQAGKKRPVVQAPTGAGKTIIAAAIVNMARKRGKKVIFAVPFLSLINQTVERFFQNSIFEVGVMQGDHGMTNPNMPVQVCSVQTLARRNIPKADLVIVDECHNMFKLYDQWMNDPDWKDVPFIGLTATPWAKGMGKAGRWDDLIVCTTTADLIAKKTLSDFRVFAPAHPDLSGVQIVAGDYKIDQLASVMDRATLVADIIKTWLQRANGRPTVAFCVDRTHAKHVEQQFLASGVAAAYMDAFTKIDERDAIVARFKTGEVKVLCNVGVLTTGFDADVRCIILARPTKSEILYTQMIGRGLRQADGKDHCLILDHSDTTLKLGFVTDIHHDSLDDGTANRKTRTKSAPLPKECPQCTFLRPPRVSQCPACGFKPERTSQIECEEGDLYEIDRDRKAARKLPIEEKKRVYAELLRHAFLRGYKNGWAYHAYKERFGVGPASSFSNIPSTEISQETQNWITYRNIRQAKSKGKAA